MLHQGHSNNHVRIGALIVTCFLIAIALLGNGDAGLRPALRQLAATGDARAARRFALAGLVLTILAIGFMTRALRADLLSIPVHA